MKISKLELIILFITGVIVFFLWGVFAEELRNDIKSIELAFSWSVKTVGFFLIILGFYKLLKLEAEVDLKKSIPSFLLVFTGLAVYALDAIVALGVLVLMAVMSFVQSEKV